MDEREDEREQVQTMTEPKTAKPPKPKPSKKTAAKKPETKPKKSKRVDEVLDLPPIDPKLPKAQQEVLALKRIANAGAAMEQVEADLAKTRHEWAELCAKRRVSLKAAIEASSGTAAERMARVLKAHQDSEEAEAGRKIALADVLDRKKKLRKVWTQSFTDARQMEIEFGAHKLPAPPKSDNDETPEKLAAEDDRKHAEKAEKT